MVEFRNAVEGTGINDWWTDDNQQIAFGRGDKGFIAFTNEGDLIQTLQTGLPAGVYCDVISGGLENGACSGKSVTVNSDSTAYIELGAAEDDGVLAIHVNARLSQLFIDVINDIVKIKAATMNNKQYYQHTVVSVVDT